MNRRCAFSLMELMFILMLYSIAALVATRLVGTSMRAIRNERQEQNDIATLNHLASMLHDDVLAASSAQVPDPQTIVLTQCGASGATIRWKLEDRRIVRSVDGANAQTNEFAMNVPLRALRQSGAIELLSAENDRMRFTGAMLAQETRR